MIFLQKKKNFLSRTFEFNSALRPTKKWFEPTDVFVLVYNITSTYSFDAIPHFYESILKARKGKPFPMVLAATGADLENKREITTKEGASVAYKYKCPFHEVSSLSGAGGKIT